MLLLDRLDHKLLARLRRKEAHTSQIALEIGIPRTSVAYRLARLQDAGKVTHTTAGRKTLWRLTRARIHNKGYITEFKEGDFLECYKTLLLLPKDSVVYAAQGSAAGEAEINHLPHYFIKEILSFYKRRRIIMRGISNKKLLSTFAALEETMKTAHTKKTQSIKLTESLFLGEGELFATKYFVIIANPKKRRGLVIKEPALCAIIYDTMVALFALADRLETFDIQKYFAGIAK